MDDTKREELEKACKKIRKVRVRINLIHNQTYSLGSTKDILTERSVYHTWLVCGG